ncbi:solute carrier family 22 member 16, partial [Silurus asotus]
MKTGVERLFDELGHFKRFQACLYFAAVFQAISCGIHYLASVFLVDTPKFLCNAPLNITNVLYKNHSANSLEEIWPFYTPGNGPVVVRTANGEQWELGPCRKMLRHLTQDFQYEFVGNKSVESCRGYVFDHSQVEQSIVTEWDLVCEKEWLAKITQPTFMMGVLIGALLFGDMADRIGRRPILIATSVCQFVFGITVAFTGNYYIFILMRFLLAMLYIDYVVITMYTMFFISVSLPLMSNGYKKIATRLNLLVSTVRGIIKKFETTGTVTNKAGRGPKFILPQRTVRRMGDGGWKNGPEPADSGAYVSVFPSRCIPPVLQVLELIEENALLKDRQQNDSKLVEPEKKLSILNMFGSWKMAGRSATCWAIWFIGSLGYYVFSLGSVNLGGNQYINLFVAGAVELPSYLIGCYAMDRVGRKMTCAPSLMLSGVACMLIIAVPQDFEILAVILSMTGKFAIAIAFGLIYLYTCELYPTIIRSLAVGSGSMSCRIGSVVAPFCVYLADVWTYLPQLIVGILSFIIGVLCLFLPETLGEPLTSTLEEAEALGTKTSKKTTSENDIHMN